MIIDDGSTDNSIKIVKEFSNLDKRIKLLYRNREPKGANTCRNIGIKNAKGEFLIFLDSDDLLAHNCLSKRLDLIEKNDGYDMYVFNMSKLHPRNQKKGIYEFSSLNPSFKFISGNFPWSITCPMWKLIALRKLKGFNEEISRYQDPEIHLRACLNKDINIYYFKKTQKIVDSYYRLDERQSKKIKLQKYIQFSEHYFDICYKKIKVFKNSKENYNMFFSALLILPINTSFYLINIKAGKKVILNYITKLYKKLKIEKNFINLFKNLVVLLINHNKTNNNLNSTNLFIILRIISKSFNIHEDLMKDLIKNIFKYYPYDLISLSIKESKYLIYGTGSTTINILKTISKKSLNKPCYLLEINPNSKKILGIDVVDTREYKDDLTIITGSFEFSVEIRKKIIKYRNKSFKGIILSLEDLVYQALLKQRIFSKI